MAVTEYSSASAEARQRGNELYRRGQLEQAERAYNEAARLAADDPAPWSNISAIKFEQGYYTAALQSIQKALDLTHGPDTDPKKQKLYLRMAKCHVHNLAFSDAEKAIALLDPDEQTRSLRVSCEELKHVFTTSPDTAKFRSNVLDRVPRYKGVLQKTVEYFPVGHDNAEFLDDKQLQSEVKRSGDVAFLFCGSGDARHLFASIISLGSVLGPPMGPMSRANGKVHLTCVDINAASLAKTLLMLNMFTVYGFLKAKKQPRIEDALTVMTYTYTSAFVPAFVVTKIMESVHALIDELENDGDEHGINAMGCFYLPQDTRTQVLRKLNQWTSPPGDEMAVDKLRSLVAENRRRGQQHADSMPLPKLPYEAGSKEDCKQDFDKFGVIFPQKPFLERRDPELIPMLEAWREKRPGSEKDIENHIDSKWMLNPTMVDRDFEAQREAEEARYHGQHVPYLEFNPLHFVERVVQPMQMAGPGKSATQSCDGWFEAVSMWSFMMRERLQIELIAGEMADILERMHHGCMEHRSHKPVDPKEADPTTFPRVYDRIHMSNVPDYIGGPLGSHLYGGPLLRPDRQSNLRFNNLLNPPVFENHAHFLSEYLLMHDAQQVGNHFGLIRTNKTPQGRVGPLPDFMQQKVGLTEFCRENYFIWGRSGVTRIPRNQLMPRPNLEHWLYGHLLKICLPHKRAYQTDRPIHAPLNITTMFRLVARMHEIGYPAHWLSGVLSSICEGNITTTARPPRKQVLAPEDVDRHYEKRTISVEPWRAEFTTLLSIWRRLLPFGLVAPEKSLVSTKDVIECSITFPDFQHDGLRHPHTVIILFDTLLVGERMIQLPEEIQDDEEGDSSTFSQSLRKAGIHMITAFNYKTVTRTANFWMRKDIVAEWMTPGDKWAVGMCRTEGWDMIGASIAPVVRVLKPGSAW